MGGTQINTSTRSHTSFVSIQTLVLNSVTGNLKESVRVHVMNVNSLTHGKSRLPHWPTNGLLVFPPPLGFGSKAINLIICVYSKCRAL